MKIAKIEDLHCDAGWRDFSFLKITTDDGLIGWSEYNEGYGSAGLTAVIRRMAQSLIGHDPRPIERIMTTFYAITRQAPGGIPERIASSANLRRSVLPSPDDRGLGLRGLHNFGATCAFTHVTARRLAHHPEDGFVNGLQDIRFPSCLPFKLRGVGYYPGGTDSHGTCPPLLGTLPS